MHYAFAIENLAKGLLLAQGHRATDGDHLDKAFRIHDLVELCERGKIDRSPEERELLVRIGRFMELARYPVCARADKGSSDLRLSSPRDPQTIMSVLQRLDDAFRGTARASVEENLEKLGVEPVPIDEETYMTQIAMLHGERLDGSDV